MMMKTLCQDARGNAQSDVGNFEYNMTENFVNFTKKDEHLNLPHLESPYLKGDFCQIGLILTMKVKMTIFLWSTS